MALHGTPGNGIEASLNGSVPADLTAEQMTAFATALGLPTGAGEADILAAIAALHARSTAAALLERVADLSLERVCNLLALPATASALDCAAGLADQVPADMARTAIVTVQLVEARDTIRRLQTRDILREALRH